MMKNIVGPAHGAVVSTGVVQRLAATVFALLASCMLLLLTGCQTAMSADPGRDLGSSSDDAGVFDQGLMADLSAGGTQPFCSVDGWCWRNPLPQGNPLQAVYAASPSRIWMVPNRFVLSKSD